ncbi:MAG: prolyl oligopeptidase family serine peptidase [Bacillota bacterium]
MDEIQRQIGELKEQQARLVHVFHSLLKAVDDIAWYHRVSDVARIDKVVFTGPPPANTLAQNPQDRGNPVRVPAYTFIPRETEERCPLLVFPHGGVHANFSTANVRVVRELIVQGYAIIAPEYRGSTGYGEVYYNLIDYGGLEVEDAFAARNWMIEAHSELVDPDRVGIIGWSHGGLITLMNIFNHPEAYRAAYAGVPVSDLVARMGYKTDEYRKLFSAPHHIGQTAYGAVDEYRRRSPAWQAEKLETPLLIQTTTNDEDVNVLEVEHLIKALKAEGKEFEYEVYRDAPGGHVFNRIDTALARQSRSKIYHFLARHLCPPHPPEDGDT